MAISTGIASGMVVRAAVPRVVGQHFPRASDARDCHRQHLCIERGIGPIFATPQTPVGPSRIPTILQSAQDVTSLCLQLDASFAPLNAKSGQQGDNRAGERAKVLAQT
jgi:hypothetical protein